MLLRSRLAFFAAVLSTIGFGCSGADFEVPPADSSTPSDSSVDTITPDACTPNACGGCTALAVKPGEKCGVCGTYICDSLDSMQCDDPGKNLCGGCGKLAGAFGGKCGDCGRYACKEGGTDLECLNPSKNACGGCKPLPGAPGDACGGGSCGTGKFVCNGLDSLDCSGVPTANKCGGCGTLGGVPGDACGSCGLWECAPDKASVKCKEGTPAVGTSCGLCGTSKYACTIAPTTSCSKLDDRTLGLDLDFAKAGDQLVPSLDHSHDYGIAYAARHTGRISTLKVTVSRDTYRCPSSSVVGDPGGLEAGTTDGGTLCSSPDPYCKCTVTTGGCSCTGTLGDGLVWVYLYKGVPGGTLTYIGAAAFSPTAVPLGSSGNVTVTLPGTLPSVTKGDPLLFWFLTTGTNWRINFWGVTSGGGSSDPDLTEYTKLNYPYSPWTSVAPEKEQPQATVQMFGCF